MNAKLKVGQKFTEKYTVMQLNGSITTEYISRIVIAITEKYISFVFESDYNSYMSTTDPAKKRRKLQFMSYKELNKIMNCTPHQQKI